MSITARINALRKQMSENNISAALITSRSNVFYLSGFTGDSGDLIITADACYILADSRFLEQAGIEAPAFHIVDITNEFSKKLSEIITGSNVIRLWFEDRHVTYAMYKGIEKKALPAALIPMGDTVEKLRLVKDEEEIENIKTAAKIADDGFSHIIKLIKPGVTEIEIAAEIEYFMKKSGAQKTSFDTIAVSGSNTSKPHGQPTNKPVAEGEFIMLDYGCVYNGYSSDITRTIALGSVPGGGREMYNSVYFTQLKALSKFAPGVLLKEIDEYARRILNSFNLDKYFGHALGHGVGINVHEQPSYKDKEAVVTKNTVVTVEPGIYFPGEYGIRIEDMVLVTESGTEILTTSPKELIVL